MYLVLTVASLLSVFPLYYMFCASTNRSIDVIAGKLIPGTYLMENFKSLIAHAVTCVLHCGTRSGMQRY